jgi:hypothetical protein
LLVPATLLARGIGRGWDFTQDGQPAGRDRFAGTRMMASTRAARSLLRRHVALIQVKGGITIHY